jgi:hypothetical protein
MDKLYQELYVIRTRELHRIKKKQYEDWVNHYREHLDELYDIYLKYKFISYDDFLLLSYESTISLYDYQSKGYKKFLM